MRALKVIFFAVVFLLVLSCENKNIQQNELPVFKSYRDIPGVTAEEIAAIVALREQYSHFVYGMNYNMTEAFPVYSGQGNEIGINAVGESDIGGYTARFCDWLTVLFGIPFRPAFYEWNALLSGLENGDVHFTGDLTITEERKQTHFMTSSIAERLISSYRITGTPSISEISNSRPPRLAFVWGFAPLDYIREVADYAFETVFINDNTEAYEVIKSGEADAYLTMNIAEPLFNIYGDVVSETFYPLVFASASLSTRTSGLEPVISVVQKALDNGGTSYLAGLYTLGQHDYKKNKLLEQLTPEELDYIQRNPVVKIATETDSYPLSFYNYNEKEYQGIAFDVMKEIELITGLSFEVANTLDTGYFKLTEMVENGETSMITAMMRSRERENRFLLSGIPLMREYPVLISKSEFPNVHFTELSNMKTGLVRGTIHAELFKRWFPNNRSFREYDNLDSVFYALERGEIDLFMSMSNYLLSIENYKEHAGYKSNIEFNNDFDITFGFNKDEAVLSSIVDKAFALIDLETISGYWTHKRYDYRVKIAEARLPWLIGATIMSLVVLSLILTMFYRSNNEGKRLAMLVKEKTSTISAIFDATSDLIFCKDSESRITECNKSMENYFGINKSDIIGKNDVEAFGIPQDLVDEYTANDKKIFKEKHTLIVEEFIPTSSGKNQFFETIKSPLIQNGEVTGLVVMSRDITQRKEMARQQAEAEAKAKEADERARLMLDSTPLACTMIAAVNGNYSIIDCNKEALNLFGVSTKQEYVERFFEFWPERQPDGQNSFEKGNPIFKRAFETGRATFEWMHIIGGEPMLAEVTLVQVEYGGEHVLAGYTRDLRALKAAEEKTREADERAQLMLEQAPLVVMLWDENLQILDCNQEPIRVFGVSSKKEYIERFYELTPEYQPNGMKTLDLAQSAFTRAFETGYNKIEWWMNHAVTGEKIPFEVTSSRVKYKEKYAVITYALDMRERNAAIAKTREADERAQIMFDVAPYAGFMFDKDFNMINCNQEVVRMFEIPDKEFFLSKQFEYFPKNQPDGSLSSEGSLKNISLTLEKGYHKFEYMHQKMNGEPLPAEVTLVRVKYNDEYILAGYMRDLTEQKAMVQLAKQQAEAESANRAKSAFLASMSHEIRTPMNAILGITEIQLQNELSSDTRNALNIVHNSGYTLLGIVNDLLDLSKIEADKMELIDDRYETASLINDSINLNTARIGSKPVEFKLHVDEDLPAELIGDELRVKQILNNLLSNAFKYTDKGEVSLSFSARTGDDDLKEGAPVVTLTIIVRDTGQGMTEGQIQSLFDAYSRFNMKANRFIEGTGLGMNIVYHLVQKMDGDISVDSTPGVGTEVTVHLKQGYAGPAKLGSELAENLKGFRLAGMSKMKKTQIVREPMPYGRVLVVDDMETNLYVARGFLLPYGLTIDTALSGREAVEKIERGNVYDIIFMDHIMPVMDGLEAVKIIRAKGYAYPIVALTANAVSGQADIFMSNGFDGFISKPIDIREMNASLNKFVRDRQPPEVVESARAVYGDVIATSDEPPQVSRELAKIFTNDAEKAIAVLQGYETRNSYESDNLSMYIINVHALKSALANIGEMEISGCAKELEQAGRDRNIAFISKESPSFLNDLRAVVERFKSGAQEYSVDSVSDISDEDKAYLHKTLLAVKEACAVYDKKAAKAALAELKQKPLPKMYSELLDTIAEHLLHSDFNEAAAVCEAYLSDRKEGSSHE
jgi:PAS domain S-box-containing protein